MPLLSRFKKTPANLAKSIRKTLTKFDKDEKSKEKAMADISKHLEATQCFFNGTSAEKSALELTEEFCKNDILSQLFNISQSMSCESKKHLIMVFNHILSGAQQATHPIVDYICKQPEILYKVMAGYEDASSEIAIKYGILLQECICCKELAKTMLYSEQFYDFFRYMDLPAFEVASHAFDSFKELLTLHKFLAAEYLETNYEKFFQHYKQLLVSPKFFLRLQSVQFLGELLMDRINFSVTDKYIRDSQNLKMIMNLMREKARSMAVEAFHVFKIFVVWAKKSQCIVDILTRNKTELLRFLEYLEKYKDNDEQFTADKSIVIQAISQL